MTAMLIASALALLAMFEPAEMVLWQMKPRLVERAPSGEIVFVGTQASLADADRPAHRFELATAIRNASDAGAKEIYINEVFDAASTPEADQTLKRAIDASDADVTFVRRLLTEPSGELGVKRSILTLTEGNQEVVADRVVRFLGYTEWMEYGYGSAETGGRTPSLAAAMAGLKTWPEGEFGVDYTFRHEEIPFLTMEELVAARRSAGQATRIDLAGKTLIFGQSDKAGNSASVPGLIGVPPTYVFIYAAETLLAGAPAYVGWLPVAAVVFALLLVAGFLPNSGRGRAICYTLAVVTVPAAWLTGVFADLIIEVVPAGVTLLIYAGNRLLAMRAKRQARIEPRSGFPNFIAFAEDMADQPRSERTAIVIVRPARVGQTFSVLSDDQQRALLGELARILSVGEPDRKIYWNGTMFGFALRNRSMEEIRDNCRGLEALCDRGWSDGSATVDLSLLFGVAFADTSDWSHHITDAIAAAESAHEPEKRIVFSEKEDAKEKFFTIGMRTSFEDALEKEYVHLNYQPQLNLRTGEICGAEALVRWNDPQRGHIPPYLFIQKFEEAGKLGSLTYHVLQLALKALVELRVQGIDLTMSINVSSTQLGDTQIAEMIASAIDRHGIEPSSIMIELTETAKIANYSTAEMVLSSIRGLGVKTSLDDFGVGMTNMETLLKMPFDELKVDRLFVSRFLDDRKASAIVKNLISLGKSTEMQIVAEGVEDSRTLTELSRFGCDIAQGYHIARPMPLDDFLHFPSVTALASRSLRQHGK